METEKKEEVTLVKVTREPLSFIPKNLDEAWRQSELLCKANVFPDALRGKPHDVLVTIMTGAELASRPCSRCGTSAW
jgi:hypothetical protein